MFAIVMRLLAYGGRRGPISVRAALGPTERMRIDYSAIRFGYLINGLLAIGAQLKRIVEERSSPASGPLEFDYQEPVV